MSTNKNSLVARYGIATIAYLVASIFTFYFWDSLFKKVPFALFFAAVSAAAWFGGFWPGFLVALFGSVTTSLLMSTPDNIFVAAPLTLLTIATFICYLIEQRRRAERAARDSSVLFSTVFRASPISITISRLSDGKYIDVNEAFLNRYNLTREDVIGSSSLELNLWADPEERTGMIKMLREQGSLHNFETQFRKRSGECGVVLLSAETIEMNGQDYMLNLGHDITERKQAEEALRESQAHYQTLVESLPNLIWTCNQKGECDYLSRQWLEYTGRPVEEQLGYGWAEQIHPDDRKRVEAVWQESVEGGSLLDIEFRIRRADGVFRWFKTRAVPLRNSIGQVVKWFGSNTDIDDYKQAERKLQAQLERMNLLDQITRAIGERQDLRSIFQVVVRSLEDLLPIDFGSVLSYDKAQDSLTVVCVGIKSQPLALELAMGEQARIEIDQNGLSQCMRGKLVYEPDISQSQFPFPKRLAQGELRSLVIAPLLVESSVFGALVAARREAHSFTSSDCEFIRQLSEHVALAAHQAQIYSALQQAYDELRQSQQTILQQERLRALGQMASGIAHDINNAISPVALYTESLLEREPNLSESARDYLTTIQQAIEDVAQTVSRMREFYRQREPQLNLIHIYLNRIVEQVIDLTRARWRDIPQEHGIVIDLQTDLARDLPSIIGVESEIRDALTNLILNAIDAMPEGGRLTLRTRAVSEGAIYGSELSLPVQVYLEVSDTGTGMDEETRRRCLEPFFSTKGERGTGLGLAMVYGMAQRQNAEVEIESEPGKGTTIRIIFQASDPVATSVVEPTSTQPVRRLRLLIVDDDPLLIKSLRDTLESDGHLVAVADGGQAGIDTFVAAQEQGEKFAAVITDLGMPYVGGRKVAAVVKATSATTPVILLTGWGQRLMDENDVPPNVDYVLNKPPKLAELRKVLTHCCSSDKH
jgi:PAS domain S-box-containing protein